MDEMDSIRDMNTSRVHSVPHDFSEARCDSLTNAHLPERRFCERSQS